MASATEILSIKGDPYLAGGLNASADTPELSQAARDLALYSVQRNRDLYLQRIKDRDEVNRMIDDDALVPTDILEQHRGVVDGKLQKIQDFFVGQNKGDILSDPKKYREYVRLLQDAKNTIKQAQKFKVSTDALLKQRGEMDNEYDLQNFDKFFNKETQKDLWTLPNPYVKLMDFDLKTVNAPARWLDATTQGGRDQYHQLKVQDIDTQGTLAEYQNRYLVPQQRRQFQNFQDHFLSQPNAPQEVARLNQRLTDMNGQLGLKPGAKGYIEPLTGRERADEFAAKVRLAEEKNWRKTEDVYLDKERDDDEQARHNKVAEGIDWFNAWTERMKQKTDAQYKQWTMQNTGVKADEAKKNGAWTYATNMLNDIAAQGIRQPDGSVLVLSSKLNHLTPDQRKYLGQWTTGTEGNMAGKSYVKPWDRQNGAMIITKDGGINFIPQDKIRVKGRSYHYAPKDVIKLGDVTQVADNRLRDQMQVSTAGDMGAFYNNDTQGKAGDAYDQKSYNRHTAGAPGGGAAFSSSTSDWKANPDGTWTYKDGTRWTNDGQQVQ